MDDVPYEQRQLKEFRYEIWVGWIWVNRDRDANSLENFLGSETIEMMELFQCESLRTWERMWVVQNCNWKVITESYQEVYHFKHIHQQDGVTLLDQRGARMGLLPNGHTRMVVPLTKRMQQLAGMSGPTDWGEDTAEIEQARDVTHDTPVTIMEQDTRNMNPMHKSLSSPGLLGIR